MDRLLLAILVVSLLVAPSATQDGRGSEPISRTDRSADGFSSTDMSPGSDGFSDSDDSHTSYTMIALPAFGLNRGSNAQPIWSYPRFKRFEGPPHNVHPLWAEFLGLEIIGIFDEELGEGNGNARSVVNATDDDVMATYFDPVVLPNAFGMQIGDFPSKYLNVPIHDPYILTSLDGLQRTKLPCAKGGGLQQAISEPCRPIQMSDWKRHGGVMEIRCFSSGEVRAEMSAYFYDMLPNRMHTVWIAYGDPTNYNAVPFGGVPNVVVTDKQGTAKFQRDLDYCPHEDRDLEIIHILVHLRTDFQNYGAVPHTGVNRYSEEPFSGYEGTGMGLNVNNVLMFGIEGEVEDEDEVREVEERSRTRRALSVLDDMW